jgi:hypothetical protein
MALDAALWTYYVNFPLLFHPVDVLRKFGLNGPVGIVVDAHCGHAVRASVSQDDYRAFLEYSAAQDVTRDVLEWANARPDLTDDALRAMWNADEDGPWPGAWKGYGLRIAKLRAQSGHGLSSWQ